MESECEGSKTPLQKRPAAVIPFMKAAPRIDGVIAEAGRARDLPKARGSPSGTKSGSTRNRMMRRFRRYRSGGLRSP